MHGHIYDNHKGYFQNWSCSKCEKLITNAYKVDNSNQYNPLSIFPICKLTHCLTNAPTYIEIPISPQQWDAWGDNNRHKVPPGQSKTHITLTQTSHLFFTNFTVFWLCFREHQPIHLFFYSSLNVFTRKKNIYMIRA